MREIRETTDRICRTSTAPRRVPILLLAVGIVAAVAVADTEAAGGCPENLGCGARMAKLVTKGVEESSSLRTLVQILGGHSGIELQLEFRRQEPGKHARSFLTLRGVYARDYGEVRRKVTGVTGEVTIPWVAYGHEQITRLAHELQHVRLLLESEMQPGSPEEEQAVIHFEDIVRSELGFR